MGSMSLKAVDIIYLTLFYRIQYFWHCPSLGNPLFVLFSIIPYSCYFPYLSGHFSQCTLFIFLKLENIPWSSLRFIWSIFSSCYSCSLGNINNIHGFNDYLLHYSHFYSLSFFLNFKPCMSNSISVLSNVIAYESKTYYF